MAHDVILADALGSAAADGHCVECRLVRFWDDGTVLAPLPNGADEATSTGVATDSAQQCLVG
ncbi:MAG: hypothetical protein ACQETI_04095 [Halobacteriota archaeon]